MSKAGRAAMNSKKAQSPVSDLGAKSSASVTGIKSNTLYLPAAIKKSEQDARQSNYYVPHAVLEQFTEDSAVRPEHSLELPRLCS
jgi:hypothetical protein